MGETPPDARGVAQAALAYLDALYGFAMTLTRHPNEAEDLVQETYLRALRAGEQFSPETNLKAWLFTIMRNAWLNDRRHLRNGPELVALDPEAEVKALRNEIAEDPQVLYLRAWEREQVRGAIERLPRSLREVVVLRDLEGFSYKQIAAIIASPIGTVMSRLARARERLRVLLAEASFKVERNAVPDE
jgi:RNA polymerase sigma-70 factor (ECF subfamily)